MQHQAHHCFTRLCSLRDKPQTPLYFYYSLTLENMTRICSYSWLRPGHRNGRFWSTDLPQICISALKCFITIHQLIYLFPFLKKPFIYSALLFTFKTFKLVLNQPACWLSAHSAVINTVLISAELQSPEENLFPPAGEMDRFLFWDALATVNSSVKMKCCETLPIQFIVTLWL